MDYVGAIIGVLGTILGGVLSYAAFHRNSKKDSESEGKEAAGWSYAKVSFALRIAEDGELRGVIPLRQIQQRGKKEVEVSQNLCVPRQKKRTSGIDANFLCDGMSRFLGINGGENTRRAADCFAASRKLHLELLQDARGLSPVVQPSRASHRRQRI